MGVRPLPPTPPHLPPKPEGPGLPVRPPPPGTRRPATWRRRWLAFSPNGVKGGGGHPPGGVLGGVQTFLKPKNAPPHRLPLLGDVFIGAARAQVDEKLVQLHSRA